LFEVRDRSWRKLGLKKKRDELARVRERLRDPGRRQVERELRKREAIWSEKSPIC
jgi:hypothetical protein